MNDPAGGTPAPDARLAEERLHVRELYREWLERNCTAVQICPEAACAHRSCTAWHLAGRCHQRILTGIICTTTFILGVLLTIWGADALIACVALGLVIAFWAQPLTQWLNQRPAAYAQLQTHRAQRLILRQTLRCIDGMDFASLQELKRIYIALSAASDERGWDRGVREALDGCAIPPNPLTEQLRKMVEVLQ